MHSCWTESKSYRFVLLWATKLQHKAAPWRLLTTNKYKWNKKRWKKRWKYFQMWVLRRKTLTHATHVQQFSEPKHSEEWMNESMSWMNHLHVVTITSCVKFLIQHQHFPSCETQPTATHGTTEEEPEEGSRHSLSVSNIRRKLVKVPPPRCGWAN